MLDRDPIAQRHMAKINKYRGEYDKWGNRLTKSYLNVRHLLEDPDKPARSEPCCYKSSAGLLNFTMNLDQEWEEQAEKETETAQCRGRRRGGL